MGDQLKDRKDLPSDSCRSGLVYWNYRGSCCRDHPGNELAA